MKRLYTMLVALMVATVMMAQSQVTHTVVSGETIQKIADLYHITPQKLVEANPALGTSFKVGMVLVIPDAMPQTNKPADTPAYQNKNKGNDNYYGSSMSNSSSNSNNNYYSSYYEDDDLPKAKFVMELGLGLLNEDGKSFGGSFGVRLNFSHHCYLGLRLGYDYHRWTGTLYAEDYNGSYIDDASESMHVGKIPVELGIPIGGRNFALIPFVGVEAAVGLAGSVSVGDESVDLDEIGGKFGFGAMGGLRLRIKNFNISAAYHHPLNDNMKAFSGGDKGYFSAGIGIGF